MYIAAEHDAHGLLEHLSSPRGLRHLPLPNPYTSVTYIYI